MSPSALLHSVTVGSSVVLTSGSAHCGWCDVRDAEGWGRGGTGPCPVPLRRGEGARVRMAMTITADGILDDLLRSPEGRADPYPLYRALHELAPFHRYAGDGMWYATRYDTCRNLLRDPRLGHDEERLFRRPGMTDAQMKRMRERMEKRRRRGFSMLTENPPDHTRIRRLVSRAFTTPRVEALRDRVVGLVDE